MSFYESLENITSIHLSVICPLVSGGPLHLELISITDIHEPRPAAAQLPHLLPLSFGDVGHKH